MGSREEEVKSSSEVDERVGKRCWEATSGSESTRESRSDVEKRIDQGIDQGIEKRRREANRPGNRPGNRSGNRPGSREASREAMSGSDVGKRCREAMPMRRSDAAKKRCREEAMPRTFYAHI